MFNAKILKKLHPLRDYPPLEEIFSEKIDKDYNIRKF